MSTEERLIKLETLLESLCKELLDNGQPGTLTKHDTRLQVLERWQSYMLGAIAVIGVVLAAAVTYGGVILAAALDRQLKP